MASNLTSKKDSFQPTNISLGGPNHSRKPSLSATVGYHHPYSNNHYTNPPIDKTPEKPVSEFLVPNHDYQDDGYQLEEKSMITAQNNGL
jgi:hypothetical protein